MQIIEEQNNLKTIAENGGIGGQWAENILRFFYKYEPLEKLWQPIAQKKQSNLVQSKGQEKISSVLVEPNPATEFFNVFLTKDLNEENLLEVFSSRGEKIMHLNFYNSNKIDVTNWSKGIYYVRIVSNKDTLLETKKLLKI